MLNLFAARSVTDGVEYLTCYEQDSNRKVLVLRSVEGSTDGAVFVHHYPDGQTFELTQEELAGMDELMLGEKVDSWIRAWGEEPKPQDHPNLLARAIGHIKNAVLQAFLSSVGNERHEAEAFGPDSLVAIVDRITITGWHGTLGNHATTMSLQVPRDKRSVLLVKPGAVIETVDERDEGGPAILPEHVQTNLIEGGAERMVRGMLVGTFVTLSTAADRDDGAMQLAVHHGTRLVLAASAEVECTPGKGMVPADAYEMAFGEKPEHTMTLREYGAMIAADKAAA